MSKTAKSVFIYSFYMLLAGVVLTLVPNLILSLVGLPETSEPWIRLLGLLSFATGLYYIQAARHELLAFFRASVWGRVIFAGGLTILVGLNFIGLPALVFVLIEFSGALWTAVSLNKK